MKIALLFILLALAHTFIIQDKEIVKAHDVFAESEQNLLTFTNTKGALIYQHQITAFKSLAVAASTFYGPSALDNLKFITTKMNNDYQLKISVFVQMRNNFYTNYKIFAAYDEAYASLGPGANSAQPQWSYLFFANQQSIQPMPYVFTNSVNQGEGFNNTEISIIRNAILNTEGSEICYCIDSQFQYLVSSISSIANNIICQSNSPTYSYFQAKNDRWIVIKPKNCYYTIWSNA